MPSRTLLRAFALLLCLVASLASADTAPPTLTADQIVERMAAANQQRFDALRHYTGKRHYVVDYHGFFGARHAEMDVQAVYVAPDRKEFQVLSQTGSKSIGNRALRRMLDSEKEALKPENRDRTALTLQNYDFTLVGEERAGDGNAYILQVEPKRDNKFLYRGKIWVDAQDFAVRQIEAEPAKNPSFWINHVQVKHDYVKVGEFWLPARNRSLSNVRFGGKADLTIEYTDYKVNQDKFAEPVSEPAGSSQ